MPSVIITVVFDPGPLYAGIEEAWTAATTETGALARELAPERTGKLKKNIFARVVGMFRSLLWIPTNVVPYAGFVLGGTAPHDIVPVSAQALHFVSASGDEVFTKLVHHPGTKANPFLLEAAHAFPGFFTAAGRARLGHAA